MKQAHIAIIGKTNFQNRSRIFLPDALLGLRSMSRLNDARCLLSASLFEIGGFQPSYLEPARLSHGLQSSPTKRGAIFSRGAWQLIAARWNWAAFRAKFDAALRAAAERGLVMLFTKYRFALNGWVSALVLQIALTMAFGSSAAHAQSTLYVDDNAQRGGDGSSWATAMNSLQSALEAALKRGASEIRVAQGVYVPTHLTDPRDPRSATFQLLNGVALKGGYAGIGAPDPDARDPEKFPSVLSGDILGNDQPDFVNNDENAYHILTGSGADQTSSLDGFNIQGGNANVPPTSLYRNRGGGMLNISGNPTISSCVFSGNFAEIGGGIYNRDQSSPAIAYCVFKENDASNDGSAIFNYEHSSPHISNCDFLNNTSGSSTLGYNGNSLSTVGYCHVQHCLFQSNIGQGSGAAIHSCQAELTQCAFLDNFSWIGNGAVVANGPSIITGCTFRNNFGGLSGGALGTAGSTFVTNCEFSKNVSTWIGGGVTCFEGSPTFINCNFSRNESQTGGGIASTDSATLINCSVSGNSGGGIALLHTYADLTVQNSIIWGNQGYQIAVQEVGPPPPPASDAGTLVLMNSDIQGGWTGLGSNNIDLDPLFIQPGCDNLRLGYGSPCIDMGNNAYVPAGVITDLSGNDRIQNRIVDMGAYEGPYDMLPPTACEDNLDDGYTVKLMPTGGAFNPVQKTAVVFTNSSGPDNAWVTVTQIDGDLHPNAGGFAEMGAILSVDSSLANGELYQRIYIPFDQSNLNGFDWSTLDLTYFNAKTGDWTLAPAANTQNSPDHDGPIGDRIVVEGTNFNTAVTGDLGDYGVFWNPALQKGFAWANVDHASDFAFGVSLPQCTGDCAFPSDGVVNLTDLTVVLDNWGIAPNGPASFADINHDGIVGVDDLLAVINHWGICP